MAGIPSPQPIPGEGRRWLVAVEGRVFRCHRWASGVLPTSSLTSRDAHQAGRALGELQRLALPSPDECITPPHAWVKSHWRALIAEATELGLGWNEDLAHTIDWILAIESEAKRWVSGGHRWVGSHRDVRPDNALRVNDELLLVDWDAAGPAIPGREVAKAMRWWAPHDAEFLAVYTSVAGTVDLHEGAGEDGGLVWWLETNVRLALARPADPVRQEAVMALLTDIKHTEG